MYVKHFSHESAERQTHRQTDTYTYQCGRFCTVALSVIVNPEPHFVTPLVTLEGHLCTNANKFFNLHGIVHLGVFKKWCAMRQMVHKCPCYLMLWCTTSPEEVHTQTGQILSPWPLTWKEEEAFIKVTSSDPKGNYVQRTMQCRTQNLSGLSHDSFIGWQIRKQPCNSLTVSRMLTLLRESTPIRKWMQSHRTSCMSWIKWSSFTIYIYIRCFFLQ